MDKVTQLNFQKGLHDLADKYRSRLASEGLLDVPVEDVWAELRRIRQEIADHDYPARSSLKQPSSSISRGGRKSR